MFSNGDYIVSVTSTGKIYLNGNVELVTSVEAANMLSVSRARISQLIADNRLRGFKLKALLLVPVDDVYSYKDSRSSKELYG